MRSLIILAVILISVISSIFLGGVIFEKLYSYPQKISFGVTFSPRYAKYLELNWQQTFTKMLDELGVKNLRLTTYWKDIEAQPGNFDFSEMDFMLAESAKRGAEVVAVIGGRQPRWPECHIPDWAKKLTIEDRQQKLLQFIAKVVDRYENNSQIKAWQLENEPLLSFGEGCDSPDIGFLKQEVELVRNKSNKTIIMTDSGELGFWVTSMQLSDVFGTTLYRQVYDRFLGYMSYPVPPYFYNLKSGLIRFVFARNNQKTIIAELQAEPWLAEGVLKSAEQQAKIFGVREMKSYVNYAQQTGLDEAYLWGVEWWYWMDKQGYPEYLNYAKTLFK